MKTSLSKSQDKKSRAVANKNNHKKRNARQGFELADNRQTLTQIKQLQYPKNMTVDGDQSKHVAIQLAKRRASPSQFIGNKKFNTHFHKDHVIVLGERYNTNNPGRMNEALTALNGMTQKQKDTTPAYKKIVKEVKKYV